MPHCPNFKESQPREFCSICGDGIYAGEEYLKNDDGEYIHYDCIHGIRHLLEWLGYKVEYMEDIFD